MLFIFSVANDVTESKHFYGNLMALFFSTSEWKYKDDSDGQETVRKFVSLHGNNLTG